MQGVYKILNKVNGKYYIGSSVNMEWRWKYGHLYDLRNHHHNNTHLQKAWDKYGENNFEFQIIEEVLSADTLRDRENYYIKSTNCADPNIGYNILEDTNIGLGVHTNLEVRKKISRACKGEKNGHFGKHHSEETKRKISLANKDKKLKLKEKKLYLWIQENHKCEICNKTMTIKYASGRFCSKECKYKYQSILLKGRHFSKEHNEKISKSLKGRRKTEEQKRKQSLTMKGRPAWNKGIPHSEETKLKISIGVKSSPNNGSRFKGHKHTEEEKNKIRNSLKETWKRKKGLNDKK